ncbi:MAG TPA: hypothetical protein VHZ81_00725 [Galbitalea sp.]|jgi:hypothetical protein|nr:hypothetical protein [Galbitalea sp.]
MPNYTLQPNEYVVMKSESVLHGGVMARHSDELVLTNLNIILVSKLGRRITRGIQYFPLNQIKNFGESPQAIASGRTLDVYFTSGQESFGFLSKKEVLAWADNVSKLLTGNSSGFSSGKDMAIPGAAIIAETLKDTVNTFKKSFGLTTKNPDPQVAKKCTSCGAPISGVSGQVVRCQYCDSSQQL